MKEIIHPRLSSIFFFKDDLIWIGWGGRNWNYGGGLKGFEPGTSKKLKKKIDKADWDYFFIRIRTQASPRIWTFWKRSRKEPSPILPPQSTPQYPKQHRNKPSYYPPSKPSKNTHSCARKPHQNKKKKLQKN